MSLDADSLVRRYQIRQAARGAFGDVRVASVAGDFTPAVLEALADAFVMPGPVKVAGLRQRLKQVVEFIKRAPQAWEKIKSFLGIKGVTDIPRAMKDWAKQGLRALGKVVRKLTETFPLNLYFIPRGKMPGLTDLLQRIVDQVPWMGKALSRVNTSIIQPLDRWMKKYMPTLSRPLLAAVFIWVWLNVAEITWDLDGLIRGFTGAISLTELFASLPESGIGLILAAFGVGYHLLPVTLLARLLWLVGQRYLEWVPGKGFKVNWDRMGVSGKRPELVPAA